MKRLGPVEWILISFLFLLTFLIPPFVVSLAIPILGKVTSWIDNRINVIVLFISNVFSMTKKIIVWRKEQTKRRNQ